MLYYDIIYGDSINLTLYTVNLHVLHFVSDSIAFTFYNHLKLWFQSLNWMSWDDALFLKRWLAPFYSTDYFTSSDK